MKKGVCVCVCVFVCTALFKVLNIHHQSKMHKQDTITNKTSKKNILQHLDPEELINIYD